MHHAPIVEAHDLESFAIIIGQVQSTLAVAAVIKVAHELRDIGELGRLRAEADLIEMDRLIAQRSLVEGEAPHVAVGSQRIQGQGVGAPWRQWGWELEVEPVPAKMSRLFAIIGE